MEKSCNHVLGFVEEDGYDGAIETYFKGFDDGLDELVKLKKEGTVYNFCPYCGVEVRPILDARITSLTKEKEKRQKEEQARKDKEKERFNKLVVETGEKTGLAKIDDGNYMVVFQPTKSSYGKKIVLSGPKDLILRNCVNYNITKATPDELIVETIYKVPENSVIEEYFKALGWTQKKAEHFLYFEKKEDKKELVITLDSSGLAYLNTKIFDEDGDSGTNYSRFYLFEAKVAMGKELSLDIVSL